MIKFPTWLKIGVLSVLLLISGCSGLASEPTIISTAPVPTVTPTIPPDVGHPIARIDLSDGATIYGGAQGCQNCHGSAGKGDGSVAANFTCKLPNVADPTVARPASIAEWFSVTTNGNGGDTSCLMPPWATKLTEAQRWDVTSYLYSLHYSAAQIQSGAQIWQTNCAACHGTQGAGDGQQAKASTRPVPNFADPAALIGVSDDDLYASVTNGIGAAMPAYGKTLDDNARHAVVAYLRTLSWDHVDSAIAGVSAPVATTSVTPVPSTAPLTVQGTISNSTPGGSPPASLPITLHIVQSTPSADGTTATSQDTSTIQGIAINGHFSFENVARRIGQAYVVTATYAGVQQISVLVQVDQTTGAQINLPFSIYEVGATPDTIAITQETLILDFPAPNTIVVNEGLNFKNNGQRIVYGLGADGKTQVAVTLPLLSGAGNVRIDPAVQGQFSVLTGTIVSALPLLPGESRPLQFSYTLSINTAQGATLSLPTPYTVQAFNLFLPQTTDLTISDPNFPSSTPITLKDANNQDVPYNGFQMAAPLAAGKPLTLALQSGNALIASDTASRRNTLAIVITLALIVFALTGLIVLRIGRVDRLSLAAPEKPSAVTEVVSSDILLGQIAALDEQFTHGTIAQADYDAQRAYLKAKLLQALQSADPK